MSLGYFELFGLSPAFHIDLATLEKNYRAIQSAAHPDFFVTASASDKLQSMQTATLANEAYRSLKNPANRAKYLLELQGINAVAESNTTMSAEFLIQQMEWREYLEDSKAKKNIKALESLLIQMETEAKKLQLSLGDLLDTKKDYKAATEDTRKLIFIDKVCADINNAIEQLEN